VHSQGRVAMAGNTHPVRLEIGRRSVLQKLDWVWAIVLQKLPGSLIAGSRLAHRRRSHRLIRCFRCLFRGMSRCCKK